MIGVRLLWMFTVPYVLRAVDRRSSVVPRRGSAAERLAIGWAGMRGSVSLAAALAVPLSTDAGGPFPDRDLIILVAFLVIVVTLVGQGLTLGPLINRLGICDDGSEGQEELHARRVMAEAALVRVDEVGGEDWAYDDTVDRARRMYDYRRRRYTALDGDGDDRAEFEERGDQYVRVMYELFDAQREALIGLRNAGEISDQVRRKVERELDLEESRLTPG